MLSSHYRGDVDIKIDDIYSNRNSVLIIILVGIPMFLIYSILFFYSLQDFTNERQLFAFSEETGNHS